MRKETNKGEVKININACKFSLELRTKSRLCRLTHFLHDQKIPSSDDMNGITMQIFERIKTLKQVILNSVALTKAINIEFKQPSVQKQLLSNEKDSRRIGCS